MRTLSRLAFSALAAALIPASVAGAQSQIAVKYVGTSFISCDQSPPADDAFAHCALWFKHHRLLRGTSGEELSRSRFLSPAALSRYVRGDSALIYASRYEHDTKRGQQLVLWGGSPVIAQFLLARRVCQDIWCSHNSIKTRMRIFEIGGSVIAGFGFKILLKSMREGSRAIWFSNNTLPNKGAQP